MFREAKKVENHWSDDSEWVCVSVACILNVFESSAILFLAPNVSRYEKWNGMEVLSEVPISLSMIR